MDPITEIEREADRCVLCGMCIPRCPTYRLTRSEAESPRGRVALLLALARDALPASDTLAQHVDNCLGCRACEKSCPSEVRYGRILALGRAVLRERHPPKGGDLSRRVLTDGGLAGRALRSMSLAYQGSGVQRLVRRSGVLGRHRLGQLEALLPARADTAPLRRHYDPLGTEKGRVALFTGCTGELLDRETLHAAVHLLRCFGYAVEIPPAQGCCGALDLDGGDLASAQARRRANVAAFAGYDAIVAVASGCVATLSEYGTWEPAAAGFAARVHEVTAFLAAQPWPEALQLEPLDGVVAIHVPCSARNVLGKGESAATLLRQLPATRIAALPGNDSCCGAAGRHMIEHVATATALREPKIAALAALGARYLVSNNVGCARHLAAGAQAAGLAVEVLHPVALLVRQLALPAAREATA